MLQLLQILGIDSGYFGAILIACAIVVILQYRKYLLGVFDPLILFMVAMIADATIMFGLDLWPQSAKLEFAAYAAFFWVGFSLCARKSRAYQPVLLGKRSWGELKTVLILLFVILVVANAVLAAKTGFPLLSSSPTGAKVSNFADGLGPIRRLNQLPLTFLCAGCTLMIVTGRSPRLMASILSLGIVVISLSGSKGALLQLVYIGGFVLANPALRIQPQIAKSIKRYSYFAATAALGLALVVVWRDWGDLQAGAAFLLERLLLSADIVLDYYPIRGKIALLQNQNWFDFLIYLTGPTLTPFHLLPKLPPLGSTIISADSGYGPNAQYFVVADLFFGPWWGCLYSLAVGAIAAWVRGWFFRFRGTSAIGLALSLTLSVFALTIPVEFQLFFSGMMDLCFVLIIIWPLAMLVRLAGRRAVVSPQSLRAPQ